MIINGSFITPSIERLLLQHDFPQICIGQPEFDSIISWMDTNNALSANIAVEKLLESGCRRIAKDGAFDYCPIFDQGAGLLSNVMYSSFEIVPKSLISQAKARPFQATFNRQVHTMENLYGKPLEIPSFTREQLAQMVKPLLEYYPTRDRELIANRVCETVLVRQRCR